MFVASFCAVFYELMDGIRCSGIISEERHYPSLFLTAFTAVPVYGMLDMGNYLDMSIPRLRFSIRTAFAKRLWPDLIMHPQPVSDVKLPWSVSWLRSRTEKLMEDEAFGFCDLGIAGNPER